MRTGLQTVSDLLDDPKLRGVLDLSVSIPRRVRRPVLAIPGCAGEIPISWEEAGQYVGLYAREDFEVLGRGRSRRAVMRLIPSIDSGMVGTAYDLWLRVNAIKVNRLGKNRLRELPGYSVYLELQHHRSPSLMAEMDRHLATLDEYVDRGAGDLNTLLEACLFLGQYETGPGVVVLRVKTKFHAVVVDELRQLTQLYEPSWLVGERVVLSPNFLLTCTKTIVHGAGDLVVDGRLYEIKTTTKFRLQAALKQLALYLLLDQLGGSVVGVREVVAVFPRFRFLHSISAEEIFVPGGVDRLRNFLSKRFGRPVERIRASNALRVSPSS